MLWSCLCCAFGSIQAPLQEKRAASGKVEPENSAEAAPEDGVMKNPDEPPRPAKETTDRDRS